MWSMIVQRSLFQPDVYPRKFCTPLHAGGCGGDDLTVELMFSLGFFALEGNPSLCMRALYLRL